MEGREPHHARRIAATQRPPPDVLRWRDDRLQRRAATVPAIPGVGTALIPTARLPAADHFKQVAEFLRNGLRSFDRVGDDLLETHPELFAYSVHKHTQAAF